MKRRSRIRGSRRHRKYASRGPGKRAGTRADPRWRGMRSSSPRRSARPAKRSGPPRKGSRPPPPRSRRGSSRAARSESLAHTLQCRSRVAASGAHHRSTPFARANTFRSQEEEASMRSQGREMATKRRISRFFPGAVERRIPRQLPRRRPVPSNPRAPATSSSSFCALPARVHFAVEDATMGFVRSQENA